MFRPTNSSESNLFTIRASLGFGSPLGAFNTIANAAIIASNASGSAVTANYLSSPANNLPSGFYIQYTSSGSIFTITYGKQFTTQPCINVVPISGISTTFVAIPYVVKTNLTSCQLLFNNTTTSVAPSTNGTSGLLGFDLVITGPIKIGATTGNSNKGWALSDSTNADPTSVYSYMDINLGSGFTASNSVVVSKNLKLLGSNNTITNYATSTSTLDYTQTVWTVGSGVSLTTVTPQLGMVLIITASAVTSNPTVVSNTGCFFNYSLTTLTFTAIGDTVILYGTSTTNFVVISKTSTVTIT
jgi:hypothetical protein